MSVKISQHHLFTSYAHTKCKVPKLDMNNNDAFEISGFKVQIVLLMGTVSLGCCMILRTFVPVSITITRSARPVCSNSQEESRLSIILQRKRGK